MKKLFCQYRDDINYENAKEGVEIYFPQRDSYIIHTFVHTKDEKTNADIWRLSLTFKCDLDFSNRIKITTGAEWEMALKIKDRPDFIGGFAHGDEIMSESLFLLDGKKTDVRALTERTEFECLEVSVSSKGYDPLDSKTHAVNHEKRYVFNEDGIRVWQRVEWLQDYTLDRAFLAMYPPAKTCTDTYFTNLSPEPKKIDLENDRIMEKDVTSATVFGKDSGLSFTMTTSGFDENHPPVFTITDNGGGVYNKMYYSYSRGEDVKKGDVWQATTTYNTQAK